VTGGTSSAVPDDLRAQSRAALQIDEQIHRLAVHFRDDAAWILQSPERP